MIEVVKRDGTVVPWNSKKIVEAVERYESNGEDAGAIIAQMVVSGLPPERIRYSVEEIQDLVEEALMRRGWTDHARHYVLYRAERAKVRAANKSPDPEAIGSYTHIAKYSRHRADLGRRELWPETVDRLMNMHIQRFPNLEEQIRQTFEDWVLPKLVIPSARSLQFGGDAIKVNHARMYNCSATFIDRPRVFQEAFFLLLSGCGCGFSVQSRHVDKLPILTLPDARRVELYTVADDIIGWADALGKLVTSYTNKFDKDYVEFDFSLIRPEGSPLLTSGGKAPGHVPLKRMLEKVRDRLDIVGHSKRKLHPIEANDILCEIALAVLAGGIRRSSMISLFDHSDIEMMQAKTRDWFTENPQRMMANNSAVFSRVDGGRSSFDQVFRYAEKYGEPGFLFLSGDYVTNPCAEIGLNCVHALTGATGWGFCNLTEINGAVIENETVFLSACRAASFIGTLQASYTALPYLGTTTEEIVEREALLGVSITGLQDNELFAKGPVGQMVLMTGAEAVKETNRYWALNLGIESAARCTAVKPSGTLSLLLGGVGSGVHGHHARRYFRRITANPLETPFLHFKKINPGLCEEKPNGDWCITFPTEAPAGAVLKSDLTALEFMDYVFHIYQSWVQPGTARPFSSQGLTHNVSCTINVSKEIGFDAVRDHAWRNRALISSMAFLPDFADKAYAFAPLEAVVTEEDAARWSRLVGQYKPVDWSELREEEDATNHAATPTCEGAKCEIEY